jgi:hypothetical protein
MGDLHAQSGANQTPAPQLAKVSITSSGYNSSLARAGDSVYVNFSVSEPVNPMGIRVEILGRDGAMPTNTTSNTKLPNFVFESVCEKKRSAQRWLRFHFASVMAHLFDANEALIDGLGKCVLHDRECAVTPKRCDISAGGYPCKAFSRCRYTRGRTASTGSAAGHPSITATAECFARVAARGDITPLRSYSALSVMKDTFTQAINKRFIGIEQVCHHRGEMEPQPPLRRPLLLAP